MLLLPRASAAWAWDVRSIVSQSDDEFEEFFLANYNAVVSSLTLITGDRERATDAAQEAFIKAYAKWSRIRSYDMPGAWVRRIAINSSRDTHRSERRRRRRELPQLAPEAQSPADGIVADDYAAQLLAALPRRQREVATLFYIEDLSVSEIARILGVRIGTVKSHLADARHRLRNLVEHTDAES